MDHLYFLGLAHALWSLAIFGPPFFRIFSKDAKMNRSERRTKEALAKKDGPIGKDARRGKMEQRYLYGRRPYKGSTSGRSIFLWFAIGTKCRCTHRVGEAHASINKVGTARPERGTNLLLGVAEGYVSSNTYYCRVVIYTTRSSIIYRVVATRKAQTVLLVQGNNLLPCWGVAYRWATPIYLWLLYEVTNCYLVIIYIYTHGYILLGLRPNRDTSIRGNKLLPRIIIYTIRLRLIGILLRGNKLLPRTYIYK